MSPVQALLESRKFLVLALEPIAQALGGFEGVEDVREDGFGGDYVIVHELLHFRVPNHGKLWKSLMRAHLGDYEQQEERLKHIAPKIQGEW